MTPFIDSPKNPRAKAWQALRRRSERDRTGTFLIEGRREVERALSHLDVLELIVTSDAVDLDWPAPTVVSDRVFRQMTSRQHPDGYAAVVRTPQATLTGFTARDGLVLIGDGIEKPGNIGAMLRSADAFGAAFIGSSLGTDIVNPNIVRASQGSLFAGQVAVAQRPDAIAWSERNTDVIIAMPDEGQPLWEVDLRGSISIVVGSEHDGVDRQWMEHGQAVTIPTHGTADSLNASVAAAVFLAEATRQRSI
jgi:RNA methyltransferase, TrmH family